MAKLKQYGNIAGAFTALALVATISAQQPGRTSAAKVDANVLKNAGTPKDALAGSWLSYGRTQGETRYSPLDQINTSNVSRLGLSWTYTLGSGGANQEAYSAGLEQHDLRHYELERCFCSRRAHRQGTLALGPRSESGRGTAQNLLRHRKPRTGDL